jgi:histidinol-phosphatase
LTDDLAFAIAIAREAGQHTLEYFGRPDLHVELKPDRTPVTEADRAAEKLLRSRIEVAFPDDGILGEEFGEKPTREPTGKPTGDSPRRRWILDPIDGTKSFERGVPLYGTLVALEVEGVVTAGVIFMPALREEVHAESGSGTTWVTGIGTDLEDSKPAQVSKINSLSEGLLCATSMREREVMLPVADAFGRVRGWGDCYAHLLVATGRAEAALDAQFAIWDGAPLKIVVEEAGGRFTDRQGHDTHDGGSGLSTNGLIHDDVLAILNR